MRQIVICNLCNSVFKGDYEAVKNTEVHCLKYDKKCELIVKQVK